MNRFLLLILTILVSTPSFANYALLYKDGNLALNPGQVLINAYDNSFRTLGSDNDSFSSAFVSEGSCLVVFKDSDYRGDHIFLTEGEYPSLGNYNFNDTISSMWVYPIQGRYRINACDSSDLVYFYRHSNLSGSFLAAPVDTSGGFHTLNDEVTSIKVPSGMCAILTKDGNLSGTRVEFDANVNSLGAYNFNDKA